MFLKKCDEVTLFPNYGKRIRSDNLEVIPDRFDDGIKGQLRSVESILLKLLVCFRIIGLTIFDGFLCVLDLVAGVILQWHSIGVELEQRVFGELGFHIGLREETPLVQ